MEPIQEPEDTGDGLSRRRLLRALVFTAAGGHVALLGPLLTRFFLPPPAGDEGGAWLPVARVSDVVGEDPVPVRYRRKWKDGYRDAVESGTVYLRRVSSGWLALSPTCTHLGCRVGWDGAGGRFVCPCHSGHFSRDGDVLAGPPSRPLVKLAVKVEADTIWVRPS